jgi:hypothetical protein
MTAPRRLWLPVLVGLISIAIAIDFLHRPEPLGVDFHTYVAAARVGILQGWSHIYDQAFVDAEQKGLVPNQVAQPFLSTAPVAWLVAPLAFLPYMPAYYIWAALTLAAVILSFAWSATGDRVGRWVLVAAALAPWWIAESVHVGQVVPLVAACVLVAWRLIREDRQVAAGLVLSLILLKPNTAILVPFALMAAGRYRAFAAWSAAAAVVTAVAALTLGPHGMAAYAGQLTGPLPPGANSLTVERAFHATGVAAPVLRVVIVGATIAAAFKLRGSPGLAMAVGVLGSLLMAPYLHGSDLCLLSAAAFIVWEERTAPIWRATLAAGWLLATPFATMIRLGPSLDRWPLLEVTLLAALVVVAWRVARVQPRDRVVSAS